MGRLKFRQLNPNVPMEVLEPTIVLVGGESALRKELLSFQVDGLKSGLLVNIELSIIRKLDLKWYGITMGISSKNFRNKKYNCMNQLPRMSSK